MGIFNEDGLFNRGFAFLGQLIGLNLLWILCSFPIFTVGASTTALCYCTLKLHKYGDCRIVKDFFQSFKQNFRQSTAIWIGIMSAAGVFYLESKAVHAMPGSLSQIFSYLLAAVGFPFGVISLYVFPTLAAFDNTIKKIIASAFYFVGKNVPYVLLIAAITFFPMFFTLIDGKLFPIYLFLWMTCGFSLTVYADTWFLWKLFRPHFHEDGNSSGDMYYF